MKASTATTNEPWDCAICGNEFPLNRYLLGYPTCTECGEEVAKQVRHTVVPMHKSNYMVVTNQADLRGINNKGGFFR